MNPLAPAPSPKAFVSYSHDSKEHEDRVLELCDRLRAEGIEAEVDQYNPYPPEGWPNWMHRQIQDAEFVLVVCTETYLRRFEGKEAPGLGLGISWEGAIITQAIYEASGTNTKFIPVIFSEGDRAHISVPLRATTRYRVDTEDGYEELYRRLTSQPAVLKPTLGLIRPLPPRPRVSSFFPRHEPSQGRQRGVILFAAVLGAALVAIILAISNPSRGQKEFRRQRVPLNTTLNGVYSLSWNLDYSELLLVGIRDPLGNNRLFRYSLTRKALAEMELPPDSRLRIERPASAQTVGSAVVVKDKHNFVWLTAQHQPDRIHDLYGVSSSGDSLERVGSSEWIIVEGHLFALGDVKKGGQDLAPGDHQGGEHWERGVVDVPIDAPGEFDMVVPIVKDSDLPGIYLMGYPHLAQAGDKAYFLNMKSQPEIVPLRPERSRRVFQPDLPGFGTMPDFSNERRQWDIFEKSGGIVGLYGFENDLFLLSKCPTTVSETSTRWFLTQIDPTNWQQLYTVSLPAASPHVTLAPGRERWAVLERESAYECKHRRMCNKSYSLILVPASEITGSSSRVTLPTCSQPAIWRDDPPGWIFGLSK